MSDVTMLRDADGNYYEFAANMLAAARTGDGSYELSEDAIAAARVPDDVAGYAIDPIPGVDIIVKKNPGRHHGSVHHDGHPGRALRRHGGRPAEVGAMTAADIEAGRQAGPCGRLAHRR